MITKDFLLEIGCEELPAVGLNDFAHQLATRLIAGFEQAQLTYRAYQYFATPRRLAVLVQDLSQQQPDKLVIKRGPAVTAPSAAQEGFARACNVTLEQLHQENGYLSYRYEEVGKATADLLPTIVRTATQQLTAPKMMHWGNSDITFLRPVHWVVLLLGTALISTEIFGKVTSRETHGHRFHHPGKISLNQAHDYAELLSEEGFVAVEFSKRRELILQQIHTVTKNAHCKPLIDPALLEEVTGLVEWPVTHLCQFSAAFLSVPKEALVSAIQHHQKSFPVTDAHDNLQPFFITVSNIESREPQKVIAGNERVMRARLADAAFFYEQDSKQALEKYFPVLKQVTFQRQLGTVADKVIRITRLARDIAEALHANSTLAIRAATLCKCDLLTNMVNEFPELQGVMGEYYAKKTGEHEEVAMAIREHYLPRFAGDKLPKTSSGCVIALADRIDTLIGIFGINQAPSGDKDPYSLRRAALGILRLIIEKELGSVHLQNLLTVAVNYYDQPLPNSHVITDVKQFILDRLPAYYQEQAVLTDTVNAVLAVEQDYLADMHKRILAIHAFRRLPEAIALAEANKRVKNILSKNHQLEINSNENSVTLIDQALLAHPAEKKLYAVIQNYLGNKDFPQASHSQDYPEILTALATFREPLEAFFTEVMVEDNNENIRHNRLSLLKTLRMLFLSVADISLLQSKA